MQIQNKFNHHTQQSFSGINIAKSTNCIKNIETNIDLFEITKKDKTFLNKLRASVKMNELMPNSRITKAEFDRWQEMLNLALDKAQYKDRKCIIAAKDKKPCGIITFHPGQNKYYLDCICTWPVETGKKSNTCRANVIQTNVYRFLKQQSKYFRFNCNIKWTF